MKTILRTTISCEVSDLIDAIRDKTGKSYDEVESALFDTDLYPESKKTSVTINYRNSEHWVMEAINDIMLDNNINNMYITESI